MKKYSYNPKDIEAKWQKVWEDRYTFRTPEDMSAEDKYYILPQFPYPSGSGLHVGHAEVYSACDIFARYQRMQGKKVLHTFGLDAFGLPAENYAIKTNVHPRVSTEEAGKNFCRQIKKLGISVDWDRFVNTIDPTYYKWTQWFFMLMYERGLAYRKKQSVNWCESCKTVLANEQVVDGKCERSDDVVVQREMEQWYLKITDYADRLIDDLDNVDWPEETKRRQKNWIGRSDGALIRFDIHGADFFGKTEVYTTRPDTLFGATYTVFAPEHPDIQKWRDHIDNWDDVETYIEATKKKTELDRQTEKKKTGVKLVGLTAVNPMTGKDIPIFIADYVLATYGTGSIMAVPAHDERDWEFARTFDLPIIEVISGGDVATSAFVSKTGTLINSAEFDGLSVEGATKKIIHQLEERGIGQKKKQFRLRDWSVSRQRFWGAPIPMLKNVGEKDKKRQYVFIHGRNGSADGLFFPWLREELERLGHSVVALDLEPREPKADEQAEFLLESVRFDADTVIVAHSHGGPIAFRILEKLDFSIAKLVLVDAVLRPEFNDERREDVEESTNWIFDFAKLRQMVREVVVLADEKYPIIPREQTEEMRELFDGRVVYAETSQPHFCGDREDVILEESLVSGLRPVRLEDLPVMLPDDVDFLPTGESPLNYSADFQSGVEERYGEGWKREVDTLDTFMCSSWYFFRYTDPKNDEAFASAEALKRWMPIDFYLGGEEHVNGHLLYSRFFTKVLYDAGYIDFDEPFQKNRHQGLILGEDSRKMSKRWGNVVNPSDVIDVYGADTLRIYEMFMGPLEQTKPWNDSGVRGVRRFLDRVWRLFVDEETGKFDQNIIEREMNKDELSVLHKVLKKVGDDTADTKFNTAVAAMMETVNELYKWENIPKEVVEQFTLILSPYAPHMAEELWEMLGHSESLAHELWPEYEDIYLAKSIMTVVVQVNGKVRAKIDVPSDMGEEAVKELAITQENVSKWMEGKTLKKVIYVHGKLVSVVV
jgi:leucyl-tRNA synthetase/predicted alpha/beta hydrolase family esterase